LGLLEFFDAVVISWDLGCAKPDPRLFQQAARQLRLDPAHILHVGDDEEDDFHGARAGGFQARLLDRRNSGNHGESIAALTEILELVQR
jgi:putative hydrolase of the HAD superfamily